MIKSVLNVVLNNEQVSARGDGHCLEPFKYDYVLDEMRTINDLMQPNLTDRRENVSFANHPIIWELRYSRQYFLTKSVV